MYSQVHIVSSHYNEDIDWLKRQKEHTFTIYSKTLPSSDNVKHIDTNYAGEAEAYLHYIVDNYDNLPTTIVFIHGHENAYHQSDTILNLISQISKNNDIKYKNINNSPILLVYPSHHNDKDKIESNIRSRNDKIDHTYLIKDFSQHPTERIDLHKFLFESKKYPEHSLVVPPYIYGLINAQFIVHKNLILSRPKGYWEELLEKMYTLQKYNYPSKNIGILFEIIWVYILTENYDESVFNKQ